MACTIVTYFHVTYFPVFQHRRPFWILNRSYSCGFTDANFLYSKCHLLLFQRLYSRSKRLPSVTARLVVVRAITGFRQAYSLSSFHSNTTVFFCKGRKGQKVFNKSTVLTDQTHYSLYVFHSGWPRKIFYCFYSRFVHSDSPFIEYMAYEYLSLL